VRVLGVNECVFASLRWWLCEADWPPLVTPKRVASSANPEQLREEQIRTEKEKEKKLTKRINIGDEKEE